PHWNWSFAIDARRIGRQSVSSPPAIAGSDAFVGRPLNGDVRDEIWMSARLRWGHGKYNPSAVVPPEGIFGHSVAAKRIGTVVAARDAPMIAPAVGCFLIMALPTRQPPTAAAALPTDTPTSIGNCTRSISFFSLSEEKRPQNIGVATRLLDR